MRVIVRLDIGQSQIGGQKLRPHWPVTSMAMVILKRWPIAIVRVRPTEPEAIDGVEWRNRQRCHLAGDGAGEIGNNHAVFSCVSSLKVRDCQIRVGHTNNVTVVES